jgi:hypothetical protein
MLDEELWHLIQTTVEINSRVGDEVRRMLSMPYGELMNLPVWSDDTEKPARPSVSLDLVKPSYLAFLDEQISLNARGNSWTDRLKTRRSKLENHIGKEVLTIILRARNEHCTLKFSWPDRVLLYLECDPA